MIIDTHAHLDNIFFKRDLKKMLDRCFNSGVGGVVTIGTDYQSSLTSINIAETYQNIYVSVGVHPQVVESIEDKDVFMKLADLTKNPKVVAIGETGLDYKYGTKENNEKQKDFFIKQLQLAIECNLPIIIHSWFAHEDVIEVLKEIGVPRAGGVIHCFDDNWETAKQYLDLGMYVSMSGLLTYSEHKELEEVVKKIKLNQLLVETDSPYVSPEPERSKLNNPSKVKMVVKRIAEIRGIGLDELTEVLNKNAKELFRI